VLMHCRCWLLSLPLLHLQHSPILSLLRDLFFKVSDCDGICAESGMLSVHTADCVFSHTVCFCVSNKQHWVYSYD